MEELVAQFSEISEFMEKVELSKLSCKEQLIAVSAILELSNAISEYNEKMMPIITEHMYDEIAPKGSSFLFKM